MMLLVKTKRPKSTHDRRQARDSLTTQNGFMSPRSLAALVILIVALVLPLWWLGDRSDKKVAASNVGKAATQIATTTIATAVAPAEVNDPNVFGMSWGLMASNKVPASAARMSCHGEPKDGISQAHEGSCSPYKGDTSCRLALPILCIKQDGAPAEAALAEAMNKGEIPAGWAGGGSGSTPPVAGFVLGSHASANAHCEKELGAGWRMAPFHDGTGGQTGWRFTAQRTNQLDKRHRHWVYINGQPGNCWNNKGAQT